jgi:TM2 domain-containing membrane protein YozV
VIKIKINLLLIVCFLGLGKLIAANYSNKLKEDFFLSSNEILIAENDSIFIGGNSIHFTSFSEDSILVQDSAKIEKEKLIKKLNRRKKIIASILAFPFPFGIIGLHRIYLGSKPYVPLAYISSLGGELGIIPFIDFIVLITTKDVKKYQDNPNLIMWQD